MSWPTAEGVFALGDLPLHKGGVLPDAKLVWKTHGTLNAARDNVVLYPTSYGAQHPDLEWLIGPDGILDPTRWFIVIPNMFTNGLSSSPSNCAPWPALRDLLGQRRGTAPAAARGFRGLSTFTASMAGPWAHSRPTTGPRRYPNEVARAVVLCGSARTSVHNQVFLRTQIAILEAAPEYDGTALFSAQPSEGALRAFGRSYAGWALSQDFYREGLHLTALGAPDLETFLVRDWEQRFARRPAADLLAQLRIWDAGDISDHAEYGGDLARALAAIEARVLLMPGETDLYFRVADNAAELPHLKHGTLLPIPSIWGHRAGNPQPNPPDAAFIKAAVRELLDS